MLLTQELVVEYKRIAAPWKTDCRYLLPSNVCIPYDAELHSKEQTQHKCAHTDSEANTCEFHTVLICNNKKLKKYEFPAIEKCIEYSMFTRWKTPVISSSYQQLHTKKTDESHNHNVGERNQTPNSAYYRAPFK